MFAVIFWSLKRPETCLLLSLPILPAFLITHPRLVCRAIEWPSVHSICRGSERTLVRGFPLVGHTTDPLRLQGTEVWFTSASFPFLERCFQRLSRHWAVGTSGQMCVVGSNSCDGYMQVVGSLQNTFPIDFLPKPQFCHLQSGHKDNNNIHKSHLMKRLGYNKHTASGENTVSSESPLTITYGI